MELSEGPGMLKRMRRSIGRYQVTVGSPAHRAEDFAAVVVAAHGSIRGATIVIEQIVFDPKHLAALLGASFEPKAHGHDRMITAAGHDEAHALLAAALGDWLDFYFLPEPKRFLLYADHDEYTTLSSATKGHLSQLLDGLAEAGFSEVHGWERTH